MAKKQLKKKVLRKPAAKKAVNPIVDSAREIWLAGLGAFSVAQQEGEKALDQGNKMFDKLVKEGASLEASTRKDVENAFEGIKGEIESRVDGLRGEIQSRVKDFRGEVESRLGGVKDQAASVRKQASGNWDKLENIFEDRVARALTGLGIPTRDDVNGLSIRVQKLARQVELLAKSESSKKTTAVKTAVKQAAPAKPVAKKAVAKKAVVKKATPAKPVAKKAVAKKAVAKKAAVKAPVAKKAVAKKVVVKKAATKKVGTKKAAVKAPVNTGAATVQPTPKAVESADKAPSATA